MDNIQYIGIDISCKTFDVAIYSIQRKMLHKQFDNDVSGFDALLDWLNTDVQSLHVCMEATNVYWEALAYFLVAKGTTVSIVNPKRIKGYANSLNLRSKTDIIDAKLIARYCAKEQPEAWQVPNANQRSLLLKLRQLEHIKLTLQCEKVRLTMLKDVDAMQSSQRIIDSLKAELKIFKDIITKLVKSDKDMAYNAKLLKSIPAIGEETLYWLLAYLGNNRFDNAKQATAYAGLTPMLHESGTSLSAKPRISKIGHAEIRKILYMPAMSFAFGRHSGGVYQPFVQRLIDKGKPKKVIIVALMRKLLAIAHGVLKSQKPFDASLHQNCVNIKQIDTKPRILTCHS